MSHILQEHRTLTALVLGIVLFLVLGQVCLADVNISDSSVIKGEVKYARIHDIQGASHQSPLLWYRVINVSGVVTSVLEKGFFMQDPMPDDDDVTSEGIFVYTKLEPLVKVGNRTSVDGVVKEFPPDDDDLTITEIYADKNPLPNDNGTLTNIAPVIIGDGGRAPPGSVIEDDAYGDVNDPNNNNVFDPDVDGFDFYESLEGMMVQVNDAVIVGLPNKYSETFVVGDNGTKATLMSDRGGIVISKDDFNPERILIKTNSKVESQNVGDRFAGPIIGILTYGYGNYRIEANSVPNLTHRQLQREKAEDPLPDELTIATFNVENLGITSDRFQALASQIVDNLRSPDIVALREIQDNNGVKNDSIVDADLTFKALIDNITAAGGPEYQFFDIDPEPRQDGGAENGSANIRTGFLYRTDRGLSFNKSDGGDSTTPVNLTQREDGVHLSFNPGRIDPLNAVFNHSRKPLAAEFEYNGQKLFVIANHFVSKGGDQPLYGKNQPPNRTSEDARHGQAKVVHDFVNRILNYEPDADVVVLGDLNDFQFSKTLEILKGDLLFNVMDYLPPNDRYSINYEGNSELFDQILVSNNLLNQSLDVDIVHTNSEFADGVSDHDPALIHVSFL